ncbi:hypothetical protein I8752_25605 [Nostocaceae cyanobacterium CENA369]|uniref:Uncharacterized protein n=1 Tax=Dendronalium phyllosphericum CENA369 TaxID=1725256 RepID=A0A8J7IC10_9NOST|nr:hypothetical protein [Dendronalium phyllosphericum]MBH8576305.1 hypothetical protein [Dendronalium phyllosphericum CENA369]
MWDARTLHLLGIIPEQFKLIEDVRNLASDEDIQKWKDAIAQQLTQIEDEICLVKLQRI